MKIRCFCKSKTKPAKITGTHLEEDVISMLKSSYEND